ncbi:MAG: sigma 54-interacting transcriptional regulator [Myxococcota bacterium]|nr:sigma 54-interacting transcriptional regulator [Myxococcota bacterium]
MPTRPSGARPGRAIRRFRVTVVAGTAAGATWQAAAERCAIGSHPSNDLAIDDPTVSRFHCELAIAGSVVHVRDLGSRNGTSCGGIGIVDGTVPGGTVLVLGHTQVRLDVETVEVELVTSQRTAFGAVVGSSPPMRELFTQLEKVVASDAHVLIEGETGTGKEAVAEAIHDASSRAQTPFVIVDGEPFELAGGTLFFDEVGDLPINAQQALLRAIEKQPEVRIIAATSRDLRGEVNRGSFRADLYFRLAVVKIEVPPLRARTGDMQMLVEHLLRAIGASPATYAALTDAAFVAALAAAPWPGNVRELQNHLQQCVVFDEKRLPGSPEVPHPAAQVDASLPYEVARKQAIDSFERAYVTGLLARNDDNVAAAARDAGVNRAYLHRLLRRHGLR